MFQINGRVKILLGEGKAEDVKEGMEEDPEADVGIGCPLCGAMFDMRTGKGLDPESVYVCRGSMALYDNSGYCVVTRHCYHQYCCCQYCYYRYCY